MSLHDSRCQALYRWAATALLAFLLTGCKVALYSDLNEHEANEIVAVLTGSGLAASKERVENNHWQVLVQEHELPTSLELLRSQGLPRDRYTSMGELFEKQGLVSTPSEERMRYIHAVSQELSQTLRKVDGVVDARVHVVIPANDPLSDRVRPSSAAVFIKHAPDTDLRLLAPAVKDMVAHSIEGLTHDKVALSLFEARRSPLTNAVMGQPRAEPVFGLLPARALIVPLILMLAVAVCLAVLPVLLRARGLGWRQWLDHYVLRR